MASPRPSRGIAIVIPQHAAKPLPPLQLTSGLPPGIDDAFEQLVAKTLVIALGVVMLQELPNGIPQRSFAEEESAGPGTPP